MKFRVNILFQNTFVRYLFAIATVASTFALRIWLIPFTGTGAPFVLFFAAVLVTSLFAGVGPGICALLISLPLAAYTFVTRAGYPHFQAVFQALLFAIDGIVVIYLTYLMKKGRQAAQDANRQLRSANEEITRSMARTREVVELSPDAFFQADLDGRFTDVNQAACRLLGYDRDELVGKTIFDIIPVEDAARLKTVRADLLVPGRVSRAEWTLRRKDGTFVPVEVSSNILPDGRWQAFVRDISERKRIEDERQVFVSFLENSSDFIGIADPKGKPVYVNPAGRRMVGLPADYPVENTQIPEYYPPDQRAYASDVIVRSMVEHGHWQGETYFRHWQTQEAIPVSDEHFMIRDPETGRLLGMGTVTRDVSDVRRSQAQLRQSEERLALALRGADLGSWDWNIKTGEVTFSPRWAEMRGFQPEEIKPHVDSWSSGVHPDDWPRVQKTLTNYFQGLVPEYEVEFRVLTKSGDWIWVLDRGKVFARDEKGYPLRMVGTELDITKRKQAEEALQESEERFRLTIDEAPIGMALVALDGRFVRVNRALCEIVGYSSDELTGLTFQAITHPDDLDADLALAGQLARGEIPRYQLGKRYIRKDGTIVDIQLSASILRSREGAPLYYIVQIEDITERKRAEAALKDSERRLTLALDSAQMGMWDLDLLTDTSVRSLRHDQIFGYSSPVPTWGAAIFMTHVVPEDREVAKRAFEKAFASDNFDMECRILWADESIHWISAKGRVYRNPKGDPVRMMGTVLDITEHKRAEEALQRSEREFRELAESMPQIVWATTADGLNIYFNQQWVDYTGLTLEESYGEGWITPFHPDDRQRAWDAWQRATQHRDTYSLECRLRRADGVYQWWLIRGVPLLGANGEISKWFGTCTDIEQIKVAEQRLKESEAKFSGIISISADAIISIDEEQRITIFNNGAEKIFGYSKAEAIGAPLDILIPERFRSIHRQHVERFAAGAVTARRMGERLTTIAGLRKNGEEFPAEAAISKLQVGDRTLLTVALRDITERKRFEKEQQLLAEAGAVLATSLDYEQTLATVAQLVVRDFADWCIVEVIEEHEQTPTAEGCQCGPVEGGRLVHSSSKFRSIEVGPTFSDR